MKKELDDKLCVAFPTIFRDRHGDMRETCMCWGFCCGDGWFDLIYDLCEKIMKMDGAEDVKAMQVKEKLGGLRFYVSGATDDIRRLIREAQSKSFTICEVCGKMGKLRRINGWLHTLCDEHNRIYRKNK